MTSSRILLTTALVALVAIVALMIAGERVTPGPAAGGRVGLGQKHMLIALHSRRQPSFQLTWNAPDAATGYTVYIAKQCPEPTCHTPTCVISPDGGPDGGPLIVGACNNCYPKSSLNLDAGTCTCQNDAGQATCVNGPITAAEIDAGGCSAPQLCCVTYPGAPAPVGQHDGIVVSSCVNTGPDGGVIGTVNGKCTVNGVTWYPYPNYGTDGGYAWSGDAGPYSGPCLESLYIETPYRVDVEVH